MKKFMGLFVVLALGVAACNGDGNWNGGGGGGGGGSTIDDPAAEADATDLATGTADELRAVKTSPDGSQAVAAVFAIYGRAFAVAGAGNNAAASVDLAAASVAAEAPSDGPATTLPACVSSTGSQVTWDNCNFNGYTVDGTISTSGDTITIDLTVGFASVTNTFTGTITASATLLDGTLHIESMVASTGISVDVLFDSIGISSGCPVSGSLRVSPSFTGNGIQEVTATFGPNCGDVTLTN